MERHSHSPEVYDYRQYDRIWQRVAPTLEPYPETRRQEMGPAVPAAQMNTAPPTKPSTATSHAGVVKYSSAR